MRHYLTMLNKERLEHTLVIRSILLFFFIGTLLFMSFISSSSLQGDVFISMEFHGDFTPSSLDVSDDIKSLLYLLLGGLSMMLSVIYFSKTLRKERQEGSLMFWRSMPISPIEFHGVKLAFGLIVIPLMCSALVLTANLYLYFINASSDGQLALLLQYDSFSHVLLNWFEFAAKMLLAASTMLVVAGVLMAISQLTNSPVLMLLFATYALQFLCSLLLGWNGLSYFFDHLYQLPLRVLLAPNPFTPMMEAGIGFWLAALPLGFLSLIISLSLSRTTEINWRSFNPNWLRRLNR